jgi:hypothetical protein
VKNADERNIAPKRTANMDINTRFMGIAPAILGRLRDVVKRGTAMQGFPRFEELGHSSLASISSASQ